MRNSVKAVLAAIAAIGVPALFAAPANAGSGPPVVGCTTGSSCSVELHWTWSVTGSTGGRHIVHWTPPPCIGVPAGDAYSGSQVIVTLYGATAPVSPPATASPGTSAPATATASATPTSSPSPSGLTPQEQGIYDEAQQLLKTKPMPAGEWYQIAGDPSASAASQQVCTSLPPYVWVKPGGRLPTVGGVNIPPEELAAFAYSRLQTGQINRVTFNPRKVADTNLPSFVKAVLSLPPKTDPGGILQVSGTGTVSGVGTPFVSATAQTPNGTAATVWAWVTGFHIAAQPAAGATLYQDQSQCIQASGPPVSIPGQPPTTGFRVGSRYTPKQMKNVGAGQSIDCGVTFTAPGTYTVQVSIGWDACWTAGTADEFQTAGPPAGKDAAGNNLCQPVPGAQGLKPSIATVTVPVREIQSVNG
jgi:hypothetical protein